MKRRYIFLMGLIVIVLTLGTSITLAGSNMPKPATFSETVRQATAQFKNVQAAEAAGYALLHGCVSGPEEGAMGIHFANGTLVGDAEVDAAHPEALLYEPKDGKLELVGVEYVVIAEAWNASHQAPPVLMGQLFNYVGAPNRYGLPPFYELHVWAWRNNPKGMFVDWNPRVACKDYVGDTTMPEMHH